MSAKSNEPQIDRDLIGKKKTRLDLEREPYAVEQDKDAKPSEMGSQEYWLTQAKPVGRAEVKLEGAVRDFGYDFKDKVVMDIGSSTGGFTELALKNGAKKVIAIEKGTDQMKEPLRSDARVNLREKTDIFTVKRDHLAGVLESVKREKIDVFLADVSFVSLKRVLEYVKRELIDDGKTDLIVMLKPQFEARPDQLLRGVIKNERIRRDIMKDFEVWTRRKGFVIQAKRDSGLPGKSGNVERFYWLKLSKNN